MYPSTGTTCTNPVHVGFIKEVFSLPHMILMQQSTKLHEMLYGASYQEFEF